MGAEFHLDPEKGFLVVTIDGTYSLAEFRESLDEITRSGRFPAAIDALWDLRKMDFRRVDRGFWRGIMDAIKEHPERSGARAAHVVEGDFAYGMARMYEILLGLDPVLDRRRMVVFTSYAEAEAWLGDCAAG